jgi:hypothetical protein
MQLKALTGPGGADLTVAVVSDAASKCAVPDALKKIQVKTFEADGSLASTRNVTDVAAASGVANVDLGQVPRDRRIDVTVLVQTQAPNRTFVVHATATTLLRPDLVVQEIVAPKQALVGTSFTVKAVVVERNGDVGASADVGLSAVPGAVQHVDVPRGGSTTVSFSASFNSPVPVEVTATVSGASTTETDATNNTRAATIDITEHQLASPFRVLFPSLLGYGAQFNMHLYAPVTPWPTGLGYGDVEHKIKTLEPQLVRIFYNDNWDGGVDGRFPAWPVNYDSFVKVVQLAQEAGATIDISFQNLANAKSKPGPAMATFAAVLEDLVVKHGLTNVRWAEVGNEPNSPTGTVTLDEYNALYRALHAQLVTRGLRDQIQLMGGGLVENANQVTRNHYVWMKWIAANMSDIVDAYAEHVYWIYDDTGRLEYRLRDTAHLMNEVLPPEQRKPTYMMEFGIRGLNACGTKARFNFLYYGDPSCTEIWRTNIAGFQQLWFNVDSAQLGVAGTAKWDAFWAKYDNTLNSQLYWMIGPPTEGAPLTPTYNAMSLLFHTTEPGWQIIGLDPWEANDSSVSTYGIEGHTSNDQAEKELVAYSGPSGQLTVIGLDTHGKDLNAASTDPPASYSIGGLPPNTSFKLAEWNATGDGTNSIAGTVTTNTAGVARFEVPLQAAFALTTVPVA